jgi:hypothetical protein
LELEVHHGHGRVGAAPPPELEGRTRAAWHGEPAGMVAIVAMAEPEKRVAFFGRRRVEGEKDEIVSKRSSPRIRLGCYSTPGPPQVGVRR